MRQDQFENLQKRAEELIDLFLVESNPAVWPGSGIEPSKMDKATRGDRVWCKRDAAASLACVQRIITLVDVARTRTAEQPENPGAVTETDDELEAEVAAAEAEAAKLTERWIEKASKRRVK